MKKRFITLFLSSLLLVTPMLSTSASAYASGWNKYGEYQNSTYWYYINPDGSFARDWQYIDGNWYYFVAEDEGAVTISGNAYIDSNGNWAGLDDSCFEIDGRLYFFDTQGRLLTNTQINVDGTLVYIDASGHPAF